MEKTRIGRIDDGFDFLSFNIRRYHTQSGTKVLTRPSRGAVSKIRQRITEELRALRGASPIKVINKMNPVIRGQANYFRPGASKKAYQTLDSHLWQNLYKWARRRHPKKGRKPAPTSISTPGQRSSGTSRSPAGTHPMTLPWPSTGPTGDESKNPRS